jgi:L-aspartate oxidase
MIVATCLGYGLDITKELIPIAPVAHYMMGGVKINMWGETNITGLFSCGEASCLGIHGANRLASNSLLEGLVIGERIGRRYASLAKERIPNTRFFVSNTLQSNITCDYGKLRSQLKKIMDQKVGPLRNGVGLAEATDWFSKRAYLAHNEAKTVMEIEVRNMLTVGGLIAQAASGRQESRGGHFRLDYPETQASWCKHVSLKR